jgi:hypothetical protein
MNSLLQISPGLIRLSQARAEGDEAFDEMHAGKIGPGVLQP